jgi:hypothetical protein
MKPREEKVLGQNCWILENETTRVSITKKGGMWAPVTFFRNTGTPVEPYYVSPWQEEGLAIDDPVLVPLRGNFFCAPFGGDNRYRKEVHVAHGEPATATWTGARSTQANGVVTFEAKMTTKVRPGTVTKRISMVDGESVLYVQHVMEGFSGKMSLGYHGTLKGSESEDALLLSFSPYQFGMTNRTGGPYFAGGEYYSLQPGERFTSLSRVPTIWKDPANDRCDSFPRRKGFVDIVQIYARQSRQPGWSAAVRPADGYMWFSLKDTEVLPSTVLWMENFGRHQQPWSGRNCCLGIEEVCSFLAEGLKTSAAKNPASDAGILTAASLSARKPLNVNCIEGVARIPKGFDRVASAKFAPDGVEFTSESGKSVKVSARTSFVHTGSLDR